LCEPSEIPSGVDLGVGMPPSGNVMPGWTQKHAELDLL
jgi:hypothetical protein